MKTRLQLKFGIGQLTNTRPSLLQSAYMMISRPVVTKHEVNATCKIAMEQFYTWHIYHEDSINCWTILELAVRRLAYFHFIGRLENVGGLIFKTV